MTIDALVVGEALVDEVVRDGRVTRHPGGSPANVALGLSRLSVNTRLHTAIGDDDDGALIRRFLGESGVTLTAASVTEPPTSRATATLAADGSAEYDFALTWQPRSLEDLGSPTVIHTGSLGALLEPGQKVTADIVRRGRAAGALISFDPNARPSLMTDPQASRAVFSAMASLSHLIKLSDEDAEYFFPGQGLDQVVDALLAAGAAVVAVTRGGDGAQLASGDDRVTIAPVVTTVVDTVGAGDSFMAALIWALVTSGWDGRPVAASRLHEVGSLAARAAAITVSRAGADLPSLSELEADERR